jgi:hypothetical protein
MRFRRAIPVVVLATLALWAPGSVAAAQTYSDTTSGFEYFATSTDGKFAGTAAGSLPGGWNADVQHTPLCLSCDTTATITGGSFSLATTISDIPVLVTGAFSGGTVQVTNVGANCTNQTFAVDGVLGSVGAWSSGSGSGTFSATLTHYRHRVFTSCITYGASIAGAIDLTF